jgi:hypothetical protein
MEIPKVNKYIVAAKSHNILQLANWLEESQNLLLFQLF